MNLTPLKYLLIIENSTCVFRNYFCFKKCTRILIICWAFIEVFNVALSLVSYVQHDSELQLQAQRIYFFSVTGFAIYIILSSLYYAKRFHQLLSNFDAFYNIFEDVVYARIMLKAEKCLTLMVVMFSSLKILVFYCVLVNDEIDMGSIAAILVQLNIRVCEFRYIYQYFILHCILFVISEQLNAITRSIDSDMSAVRAAEDNVEHEHDLISITVDQDRLKNIDKWMNAYENVNDSSNLCNAMFGIQLTIMILIVTTYYIILLYSITMITVKGVSTPSTLFMNIFSMVVFLMALFIVSRAGQKVQNSSLKLTQKLCELNLQTLGNEQYYKLSKDLLRCVRTRPVRIHVFGSLDVNMSMLPSIVAFFTSYTVIALQFNNIL